MRKKQREMERDRFNSNGSDSRSRSFSIAQRVSLASSGRVTVRGRTVREGNTSLFASATLDLKCLRIWVDPSAAELGLLLQFSVALREHRQPIGRDQLYCPCGFVLGEDDAEAVGADIFPDYRAAPAMDTAEVADKLLAPFLARQCHPPVSLASARFGASFSPKALRNHVEHIGTGRNCRQEDGEQSCTRRPKEQRTGTTGPSTGFQGSPPRA